MILYYLPLSFRVKEGGGIAPLRVKELPKALSEGTGTVPPLGIDKIDLKIEPNAASSSPPSGGGMLLDVGEEETIGTKLVVSPTSSNYRATEQHPTLGGGGKVPSCLNITTSTFDLGSSIMNTTTTDKGGGIANLLSGMHEEESMAATKDSTTIEERHVGGGNDISFDNVINTLPVYITPLLKPVLLMLFTVPPARVKYNLSLSMSCPAAPLYS